MIKAHLINGYSNIKLEGSNQQILAELSIINARIITDSKWDDDKTKLLFESILHAVKLIREEGY